MRRALLFLALLAVAGCASARGGSALYRRDIGNASRPDAMTLGLRIVNQFAYEVFQVDTVTELSILTHWKSRRPLADELALGVTAAESRMLIIGRPRSQSEFCPTYNVTLNLENRVRVAGSADWNESTNTPMFLQRADEIVGEFRKLMSSIGVRRC